MKLVNLTPHDINVRTADGQTVTVPPSGAVARCSEQRADRPPLLVDGYTVPVSLASFGAVEFQCPEGQLKDVRRPCAALTA